MNKKIISMMLVVATMIASGGAVYASTDYECKDTRYGELEGTLSVHRGTELTVALATTEIEEKVYKVVSKVEIQNNDNGKRLAYDRNIERNSRESSAETDADAKYDVAIFGTHEVRGGSSDAVYTKTYE